MKDATKKPADCEPRPSEASPTACPRRLRAAVVRCLRGLFSPLVRALAKHWGKVRRFGGLGALAVGAGFMAGGLGPLGLSLIFVGTAILLLAREQSRPAGSDRQPK